MNFIPYLTFNGDCQEAFERYAEIFAGEILMMSRFRDEESCANMPEEIQDKVMHAQLKIGENLLMASDTMTTHYQLPQSTHISVNYDDLDQAKSIFDQLSDSGTIMMPFSENFWTKGFGMVRDRFGTLWMVNFNNPASKYY